jgi:predicted GTPase
MCIGAVVVQLMVNINPIKWQSLRSVTIFGSLKWAKNRVINNIIVYYLYLELERFRQLLMAKAPEELFSDDSNPKKDTCTTAVAQPVRSSITPIDKALSALTSEQRGILQWWRNENSGMTIVTLGETGVGKSTLLNGLFGVKEFKEGDTLDPGTISVVTHQYIRIGVLVTVHDCPGLLDGTGKEGTYLDDLQTKTGNGIDLMLYCISMKETRAHLTDDPTDDTKKSAVTIVTEAFGRDIWKNTMFVLTYANVFKRDLETTLGADSKASLDQVFEDRIKEWRLKIQQALEKNGVDPSVVGSILVKPAGYYKKRSLPGRSYWLSDLWAHALLAVSDEAKGAFLRLASDRLKLASNTSEGDFKKSIEEQPIIIAPSMDVLIRNMPASLNSTGVHRRQSGIQKFFKKLWIKVIEILHLEPNSSQCNLQNKLPGETWL